MKIKVNRNYIWCSLFVEQLVQCGVKQVCISPGSRSAPLAIAFADNKKIKTYIYIDERSSGFYALGLAKSSSIPVAVVTTSGTAAAELYPSIIEAYQQRIPLIICTADRPPYLNNSGANQMINQINLYKNHIRYYKDFGLPNISKKSMERMMFFVNKGVEKCFRFDRGPVHFNFPFDEPLEPSSFSDEIENDLTSKIKTIKSSIKEISQERISDRQYLRLAKKMSGAKNGLIIVGPNNFNLVFTKTLISLSDFTGYPILADGASNLRVENINIIINFDAFLRSDILKSKINSSIILQFGRTITSSSLNKFLSESSADKFLINEFGDLFDPLRKTKAIIKSNPAIFCKNLLFQLKKIAKKNKNQSFIKLIKSADASSEKIKNKIIFNSRFPNEARVFNELIDAVPSKTNLMIGNSSPIRDLDFFLSKTNKNINIFYNRGASGIDGITSTSMGIAINKKPIVLVTGDLSFLHDLNALIPAKKYSVQLLIVVINNNGGGIFERLPISSEKKLFDEFFKTPHNQDLQPIVKSFGHNYVKITGWKHFTTSVKKYLNLKAVTVLEVQTNSASSQKLREKYWETVIEKVDQEFGLNEDQN